MKFVCTGVLLVVLLASSLARPDYFPRRQYDAEINQGFYPCFDSPDCTIGYIGYMNSKQECCRIGGRSVFDIMKYQCSSWLVQRDQSLISLLCSYYLFHTANDSESELNNL